jgi:hypothetical protein
MCEREYLKKIKVAKKCEIHKINYINRCPLCDPETIKDKNIKELVKDIKK